MAEGLIDELATAWDNFLRQVLSQAPAVTGVVPYDDLPACPPEPPTIKSLDVFGPGELNVFLSLEAQLAGALGPIGARPVRAETQRTQQRQEWLWGIGRLYKAPGRTGIVTNEKTAKGSHVQLKATDYDYVPIHPGTVLDPDAVKAALSGVAVYMADDLVWGGNFKSLNDPRHWEIKA
jgi:hypothetical protein